MTGHISDEKKKKIISDYLETESVNAAAKINGVGWKTAKKAIEENEETVKKLEYKKEQNTANIIAHMDAKRDQVCDVIDIALEVLPQKIRDAKTASEVTTALGTLIDKWTTVSGGSNDSVKEDALSMSLKEMAKDLTSDDQ